jgi:hypothetical protein
MSVGGEQAGRGAHDRSRPLRRSARLRRQKALRRLTPLVRRTPLRRTPVSPASEAQRAKVLGQACLVCARRPVDPAHLVPRSLGGCDRPDGVVPLCRPCHRRYDRGGLDLLPHLEPGYRAELGHGLLHLDLLWLLERVTSARWMASDGEEGSSRAA